MNRYHPKRGQVYTLEQIYNTLELRDSAFLRFPFPSPLKRDTDQWRPVDEYAPRVRMQVIQTSHFTEAELLALPGWAETKWTYERETIEWIPLFTFAGEVEELVKLLDMEPSNAKFAPDMEPRYWWVTPKGLPRQQYYDINGNSNP